MDTSPYALSHIYRCILLLSMGLFSKHTRSAILVDIGSASVGGGCVHLVEGEAPVLCYTARIPVEPREDEGALDAMLRALTEVCALLVREGAPALHQEAGSAHIDMVLASVAAPWQETSVRTVTLQEEHHFTFTRTLMERAVRSAPLTPGRVISDTSVISTVLNGYRTDAPYGKRVTHAELTVLTSTIEKSAAREITRQLRKAFHSHKVEITAFAPVAYAVIADLYPHQKDFIVIDVSGTATDALIAKQSTIAGVKSIPTGIHDLMQSVRRATHSGGGPAVIDPTRNQEFGPRAAEAEAVWLKGIENILSGFAAEHPLPRAVFLLADEHARDFLKRLIDQSALRTLWLSNDALSVIPLSPSHTAASVKARGQAEGDVFLSMLGLFYRDRLSGLRK